ncbi:MAG TPA: hypothetical protein VFL13_08015 [Candidatus Baltobacteraceae bacterium]|nr:hypothetical protein [Candidatus Baltobacteraceae bacterium]
MFYQGLNLPEAVWNRLKDIGRDEAASGRQPSLEECLAHVHDVVTELTGRRDSLRTGVAEFYAEELQMRINALVDGTI